jgi:hypothetical protein
MDKREFERTWPWSGSWNVKHWENVYLPLVPSPSSSVTVPARFDTDEGRWSYGFEWNAHAAEWSGDS